MGAKTWMLVYASGDPRALLAAKPALQREATLEFAAALFPKARFQPLEDGDLSDTCPRGSDVHIASFSGVSVVAAKEFGIDYPSQLPARFLQAAESQAVYLHAMHSVVDWCAFAVWRGGRLERSLSVSPDNGVMEDVGERMPFELPYWAGERPAVDPDEADAADYPLPFHPLELGEAALAALFGYQLEGDADAALFDPETVPLLRFKRGAPWWKFWSR